jgi:hypothetical protein
MQKIRFFNSSAPPQNHGDSDTGVSRIPRQQRKRSNCRLRHFFLLPLIIGYSLASKRLLLKNAPQLYYNIYLGFIELYHHKKPTVNHFWLFITENIRYNKWEMPWMEANLSGVSKNILRIHGAGPKKFYLNTDMMHELYF